MTDKARLRLRVFLGFVYAAGAVALGGVIAVAQWRVSFHLTVLVVLVALLMMSAEFMPIRVWSRGAFQEYTFSGAFALVMLQVAPLEWAVLPQAVAILVEEIRQRRPAKVAAFNVAQNVLMFVLARLALDMVEGSGTGVPHATSGGRQLLGLFAAALVYFVVNVLLTTTVMALSSGTSVRASIAAGMRREMPVTPIVLGLAPLFVASLEFSVWTAPLCLFLMITLRTAAKISTEHEIAALHDVLTGLPNRTLMLTRLNQSLEKVDGQRQAALLMIDLDHFKEINDSLGHATGDELLVLVADRLKQVTGPDGTVARLGGDEFAIVVDGTTPDAAEAFARRVTGTLNQAIQLSEMTLTVAASVGVAMAPRRDTKVSALIRNSDQALYAAKQDRGRYMVYDPAAAEQALVSPALMSELRHGIDRGEMRTFFQPKISVLTGRMIGVEALIRWEHPIRGLLVPDRFLPAAENTPLIVPMTTQVINDSLAGVAYWRAHGLDVSVSINLTPRQVADLDLPRQIEAALAKHGLGGEALVVEVTESCLIANPVRTRHVLERLRDAGVGLSIDDFGTGYSSFTQLRDLPVSEIKIDRSFVSRITGSSANAAIVKSAIDLGRNLGLNVVSEGVETFACLDALTAMGCDVMQGYLFARPMPGAEIRDFADALQPHPPETPSQLVSTMQSTLPAAIAAA
jgi:diguanylate cyclase (GGDEF)-like protein